VSARGRDARLREPGRVRDEIALALLIGAPVLRVHRWYRMGLGR